MLAMAWTHASPFVTDHISLLVTLPENRQQYVAINIHERLSLADGIVLVHYLDLTRAAQFICSVDPWLYPGTDEEEEAPGPLCIPFTQSAIDKATAAGKLFSKFTEESKSSYLLSALLLRKGDRPDLIRISKAARGTSSDRIAPLDAAVASPRHIPITFLPTVSPAGFFPPPPPPPRNN